MGTSKVRRLQMLQAIFAELAMWMSRWTCSKHQLCESTACNCILKTSLLRCCLTWNEQGLQCRCKLFRVCNPEPFRQYRHHVSVCMMLTWLNAGISTVTDLMACDNCRPGKFGQSLSIPGMQLSLATKLVKKELLWFDHTNS